MGQHEISQTNHHPVQGSQEKQFWTMANRKMLTETAGNYNLLILTKKGFTFQTSLRIKTCPCSSPQITKKNGKIYKKQTCLTVSQISLVQI